MADIDFQKFHGCACGRPGNRVARRNVELITRKWEVDIEHSDGKMHTNVVTLYQGMELKS